MAKCKVIAVSNQKGGVGKTSVTLNLGIGLARNGYKVLMIDNDYQANLTASLGYTSPDELEYTLCEIIEDVVEEKEIGKKGILTHSEGVDLVPSNITLATVELKLIEVIGRETLLRRYIDGIKSGYDYIIIDCSPSLGMMTVNALTAADSVLIPVQAAYLPVKGLQDLIRTIGKVKRQLNPKLDFEGILITMVNSRTNYAKEIIERLHEEYGEKIKVFNTFIPRSVKQEESSVVGKSIYKYANSSKVAKAYKEVTDEICGKEVY